MDPDTLQGIVYLFLILAAGAAIWILILYLMLGAARRRVAELELAVEILRGQVENMRNRIEMRSKTDEEVLADAATVLRDL